VTGESGGLVDRERDPLAVPAILLPVAIILLLVGAYAVSSDFYLKYVLNHTDREHQVVEILTALAALPGALFLGIAAVRLAKHRQRIASTYPGAVSRWQGLLPAMHVGVIALAAFFFGGEEINWGQRPLWYFFPELEVKHPAQFNVHNSHWSFISVQSLGGVFLVTMFLIVPIVWHWRKQLRLPPELQLSVPRWPIAVNLIIAMLWATIKGVYKNLYGEGRMDIPVYRDFFEESKEHKELLVAVMLLLYGLYCIRAAKRFLNAPSTQISTGAGRAL